MVIQTIVFLFIVRKTLVVQGAHKVFGEPRTTGSQGTHCSGDVVFSTEKTDLGDSHRRTRPIPFSKALCLGGFSEWNERHEGNMFPCKGTLAGSS